MENWRRKKICLKTENRYRKTRFCFLDKTFVYSKWKPIQHKNFGPLCIWVKVCNKINCSVVNSCQSWYSHDTSAIIICQNIFMFIHHQRFHITAVLKLFLQRVHQTSICLISFLHYYKYLKIIWNWSIVTKEESYFFLF